MSTTNLQQYKEEKARKFREEILAEIELMNSIDMDAAIAGMNQRVSPKENPFIAAYNQREWERYRPYHERNMRQMYERRRRFQEQARKAKEAAGQIER